MESLLALLLTTVIAEATYRYVEQPFRLKRVMAAPPHIITLFVAISAAVGGGALAVRLSDGLPQRLPADIRDWEDERTTELARVYACGRKIERQLAIDSTCTIGGGVPIRGLLWGDSHANSLVGALETSNGAKAMSFYYGADPGCPPLLGIALDVQCILSNDRRLRFVATQPEISTVILAARWAFYLKGKSADIGPAEASVEEPPLLTRDGAKLQRSSPEARRALAIAMRDTVSAILETGKTVVLVYPVPEVGFDVLSVGARLKSRGVDPNSFERPRRLYSWRQHEIVAMLEAIPSHPRLVRIRPEAVMCSAASCRTFKDGRPLYIDDNHLSHWGAEQLAPLFATSLGQSLP